MKIVFLDAGTMFNVSNLNQLERFGELTLHHHTSKEQTIERLKHAEIAISNKVVIDKQVIEQCPNLKLICVAATGTNNVDKEFAAAKSIVVKNVSDYSTQSVAQVTYTMILYLLNSPKYYDEYVKNGNYAKNDFFTHVGMPFWQLSEKKLGIIGLGNIGKQVAKIGEAFGMEITYTSISGNNNHPVYKKMNLEELLQTADVVTIHTPLTDQTKSLINYKRISFMQKHAILVNMSRGGVVVEKDLVKALDEDLIAGAGLDVFEKEPIDASNPIFNLKNKNNIVLAPHIAWASIEARELLMEKVMKNIEYFLAAKK